MDKKGRKKRQVRAKRRKGRMDEDGQWALRNIVGSILKDMTFIHVRTKSSELWQVKPAKRYKHTTYCSKIDITVGVALHCVVHTFPIKTHTWTSSYIPEMSAAASLFLMDWQTQLLSCAVRMEMAELVPDAQQSEAKSSLWMIETEQ